MTTHEKALEALKDAIEGECHGMAIDNDQAQSILSYVISALTPPDVAGLVEQWREAMEGVTPGPWETTGNSVTDFGREWPGSLSMEFIPNGYDDDINMRHKADAAWMARCSPDGIDALLSILTHLAAENALLREREGWKPIGTAPKEGLIDIWISDGDGAGVRWCDCYHDRICDEWRTSRPSGRLLTIGARHVTHWRYPPASPYHQEQNNG